MIFHSYLQALLFSTMMKSNLKLVSLGDCCLAVLVIFLGAQCGITASEASRASKTAQFRNLAVVLPLSVYFWPHRISQRG